MISIRVWNVASDRVTKAVEFLEDEFLRSQKLGHLAIRSAGRSALRKCHRKGAPVNESLRKAIQHYLSQDDYIIFVPDAATLKSENQKLVEHIRHVVKDSDFADRIYFVPDIQDSEPAVNTAWQNLTSDFHAKLESDREQFQKVWDKVTTRFHDVFADTPEEEVIRDFEEALAEVRRERK